MDRIMKIKERNCKNCDHYEFTNKGKHVCFEDCFRPILLENFIPCNKCTIELKYQIGFEFTKKITFVITDIDTEDENLEYEVELVKGKSNWDISMSSWMNEEEIDKAVEEEKENTSNEPNYG